MYDVLLYYLFNANVEICLKEHLFNILMRTRTPLDLNFDNSCMEVWPRLTISAANLYLQEL